MIIEIEAEYQSDAGTTKDTPYLALTGELWGVFCEYLRENQQRYNGTALYIDGSVQDQSKSIADAVELLQSCAKSSIYLGGNWLNYDGTLLYIMLAVCSRVFHACFVHVYHDIVIVSLVLFRYI